MNSLLPFLFLTSIFQLDHFSFFLPLQNVLVLQTSLIKDKLSQTHLCSHIATVHKLCTSPADYQSLRP